MHNIQENLLRLLEEENLSGLTLREIGELLGEKYPQKVKHHLSQLEKKGFITIDKKHGTIEKRANIKNPTSPFVSIPIVGMANCGPATIFAEQNTEGYLKVSRKMLPRDHDLFSVRADGISMNKATVAGKAIEDGDYLIIDRNYLEPHDNDIVLSIIENQANIKRYRRTDDNNIVLVSDSTREFPPIYIHEDDDFQINGKVIQVIKKPKI